jgi:hypothetical protein
MGKRSHCCSLCAQRIRHCNLCSLGEHSEKFFESTRFWIPRTALRVPSSASIRVDFHAPPYTGQNRYEKDFYIFDIIYENKGMALMQNGRW